MKLVHKLLVQPFPEFKQYLAVYPPLAQVHICGVLWICVLRQMASRPPAPLLFSLTTSLRLNLPFLARRPQTSVL